MKLITRFELACRSTSKLLSLYGETFNALAFCAPHSAEQRTCLASLENLENEINARTLQPSQPAQPPNDGCASASGIAIQNAT